MADTRHPAPHTADQEMGDAFLDFIDYARSILSPLGQEEEPTGSNGDKETDGPGWSWVASRVVKTCVSYSSGVTSAILLSELSQAWNEYHRSGALKKRHECINHMKMKYRRVKLPNTVTIDSIYEKNYLSLIGVLEAFVVDIFVLPGTHIYMLKLGDFWSYNTIELYLHRRYYDLVDPVNGILRKGRELLLTGCYFRTATKGSNSPRLLPTEYILILLDEDHDEDAMLLGAQFCSDSFSSISLEEASEGVTYSLYARIESIGPLETMGSSDTLQRKPIVLIDDDGIKLTFFLWGEQVLLANLFSVGSMLALDKPFVSNLEEGAMEAFMGVCLEYGSATQLYLVPSIRHDEQVSVTLSQNRFQGSRMPSNPDTSQSPMVSQVSLPRDSHGSVDFSNYPFRTFVADLRDNMCGFSLYGVVDGIIRETNSSESVFSLRIEDSSGAVWTKLHFSKSWSLGRLSCGHTIYMSGLRCVAANQERLEALWFESIAGSMCVSISSLPALLNSSCLHILSRLCDLSAKTRNTHICKIWLDQIHHCNVNVNRSHIPCGCFLENNSEHGLSACKFCGLDSKMRMKLAFDLTIKVVDESSEIVARCSGSTASEMLQISPEEFCELPEEEQLMYPSCLEKERYIVALVNRGQGIHERDAIPWEITCVLKWG